MNQKALRVAVDSHSFAAMSIIGQEERGGSLDESATWTEGGGGGDEGGGEDNLPPGCFAVRQSVETFVTLACRHLVTHPLSPLFLAPSRFLLPDRGHSLLQMVPGLSMAGCGGSNSNP